MNDSHSTQKLHQRKGTRFPVLKAFFLASLLYVGAFNQLALGVHYYPDKPPSLVVDPEGILSDTTTRLLSDRLKKFQSTYSISIYLVTFEKDQGIDPKYYANRLLEKWIKLGPGMIMLFSSNSNSNALTVTDGFSAIVDEELLAYAVSDALASSDTNASLEKNIQSFVVTILGHLKRALGDASISESFPIASDEEIFGEKHEPAPEQASSESEILESADNATPAKNKAKTPAPSLAPPIDEVVSYAIQRVGGRMAKAPAKLEEAKPDPESALTSTSASPAKSDGEAEVAKLNPDRERTEDVVAIASGAYAIPSAARGSDQSTAPENSAPTRLPEFLKSPLSKAPASLREILGSALQPRKKDTEPEISMEALQKIANTKPSGMEQDTQSAAQASKHFSSRHTLWVGLAAIAGLLITVGAMLSVRAVRFAKAFKHHRPLKRQPHTVSVPPASSAFNGRGHRAQAFSNHPSQSPSIKGEASHSAQSRPAQPASQWTSIPKKTTPAFALHQAVQGAPVPQLPSTATLPQQVNYLTTQEPPSLPQPTAAAVNPAPAQQCFRELPTSPEICLKRIFEAAESGVVFQLTEINMPQPRFGAPASGGVLAEIHFEQQKSLYPLNTTSHF